MRKAAARIPKEAYDRTIEYLEGSPGLRLLQSKAHVFFGLRNLMSHFVPAYHFDSVAEFLRHQKELTPNVDHVVLGEVEVMDRKDRTNTIELRVADKTAAANIVYPYQQRWMAGEQMLPDYTNSPLHGARKGDKIKIFDSRYLRKDTLCLSIDWHVKNDDHYKRLQEKRNLPFEPTWT